MVGPSNMSSTAPSAVTTSPLTSLSWNQSRTNPRGPDSYVPDFDVTDIPRQNRLPTERDGMSVGSGRKA